MNSLLIGVAVWLGGLFPGVVIGAHIQREVTLRRRAAAAIRNSHRPCD